MLQNMSSSRRSRMTRRLFGYYETVKYVQIHDTRLGLLRILLLLSIVVYVVVFEIICKNGYLESTNIVGVVNRFNIQQPTTPPNCNPYQDDNENNDSSNNNSACYNAFVPLNKLPYCEQYYYSDDSSNSFDGHDHKTSNAMSFDTLDGSALSTDLSSRRRTSISSSSAKDNNNNRSDIYHGMVYPCEIYEALNAQIGPSTESSIVIMTRGSIKNQSLVCDATKTHSSPYTCPTTYQDMDDSNEDDDSTYGNKFYVAQSEAFTILFDHAVTATKFCTNHPNTNQKPSYACSSESSSVQYGRIYVANNQRLCSEYAKQGLAYTHSRGNTTLSLSTDNESSAVWSYSSCYIPPNRTSGGTKKHDYISLDVLLQAATAGGMTLDDCNVLLDGKNDTDNSNETKKCQTYRDTGGTLLINIYWNDVDSYHGIVEEPYYYYKPQFIVGSTYKQFVQFYYTSYRYERTIVNAHGIKISVLLNGEFHSFNFKTLLVTITTSIGLLAVATFVLDSIMLYLLPEKNIYQQLKYDTNNRNNNEGNNENGNNTNGINHDGGELSPATEEEEEDDEEEAYHPHMALTINDSTTSDADDDNNDGEIAGDTHSSSNQRVMDNETESDQHSSSNEDVPIPASDANRATLSTNTNGQNNHDARQLATTKGSPLKRNILAAGACDNDNCGIFSSLVKAMMGNDDDDDDDNGGNIQNHVAASGGSGDMTEPLLPLPTPTSEAETATNTTMETTTNFQGD